MENDIEQGNDIEMASNIFKKLATEVIQGAQTASKRLSECWIYRVPKPLRNVNWKAYSPQLISIGPLHRENKRLEAMEKEKLKYFRTFTEREGMDEQKIINILIGIKNQAVRLRHCYSEKFKSIKSPDFVEMILLDAFFIIQFLLGSYDNGNGHRNFEPTTKFHIREDLMLLENQLPLFIIQEIYDQVNPPSQDATAIPFLDLATFHFGKYTFSQGVETSPSVNGSRHFTDLLRNLMLNGAIQRSYSSNPIMLKYSAVMLRKAGVKFQATQDKCLVNIKFEKGVLKIPQLEVDHSFERLVRNIMALEQCCYPSEAYACSYVKFMDHLIDSAEDVGLLAENGIIVNCLGEDAAVSNMINKLCETITDTCTFYDDICRETNAHYENRWNHRKATLKLVYFPNVWRGTATVAAAILLILTLIQTITSIKSVF
jgi:hypothetical protein